MGTEVIKQARAASDKHNWSEAAKRWEVVLEELDETQPEDLVMLLEAKYNLSAAKRLVAIDEYKDQIKSYQLKNKSARNKIAIYTSITQGYDILKPPEVLNSKFDYIVFTDKPIDGLGIFEVRSLPKLHIDKRRASRYPKLHPHLLLKDYNIAIWLDASLMIVGDIMPDIEKFIKSGLAIASSPHQLRKSLYDEFQACFDRKKDDPGVLRRHMEFYKSVGFDNNDLAENGFMMFNLKHDNLSQTLETWWEQIIKFSRRDQLSFNYSLAKHGLEWYRIMQPPFHIRNYPPTVFISHDHDQMLIKKMNQELTK